jgi:hypothetical protein
MGPRELTYSFSVVLYGSTGVSNEIPELYGKASLLQVKPLCLQIELLWLLWLLFRVKILCGAVKENSKINPLMLNSAFNIK